MWNIVSLTRNLEMPLQDKWVLVNLASYGHNDGTGCHPGIATLAHDCMLSERQVQRRLRNLEQAGLIEAEHRTGGKGIFTSYTIRLKGDTSDTVTDDVRVTPVTPLPPPKGDISVPQRVTFRAPKGDISVPQRVTFRAQNAPVPNELDLELDLELEGVRAFARPREGSIDQLTHTDAPAHESANGHTHAHDPSPLDNPMTADDPLILEIYRGYWEEWQEPFYRQRLFAPKSEWGFTKYMEAHNRPNALFYPEAEMARWQPAYRSFCVHMARVMKERVTA